MTIKDKCDTVANASDGKLVSMEERSSHFLRKYEVTFALPGEVTVCFAFRFVGEPLGFLTTFDDLLGLA